MESIKKNGIFEGVSHGSKGVQNGNSDSTFLRLSGA